jgi:hypothetical protein
MSEISAGMFHSPSIGSYCSNSVDLLQQFFHQVKSYEEIALFYLLSTQILVLLNCPVHDFPVTAKHKKKKKNIDSPTHGKRDVNNILTAAQSIEPPLGRASRVIDRDSFTYSPVFVLSCVKQSTFCIN